MIMNNVKQVVDALEYWLPDEVWMMEHYPHTDPACKAHWDKWCETTHLIASIREFGFRASNHRFIGREMNNQTVGESTEQKIARLEASLRQWEDTFGCVSPKTAYNDLRANATRICVAVTRATIKELQDKLAKETERADSAEAHRHFY